MHGCFYVGILRAVTTVHFGHLRNAAYRYKKAQAVLRLWLQKLLVI